MEIDWGNKRYIDLALNVFFLILSEMKMVTRVVFWFKHVQFKEVFRFKEEFHCSQNGIIG